MPHITFVPVNCHAQTQECRHIVSAQTFQTCILLSLHPVFHLLGPQLQLLQLRPSCSLRLWTWEDFPQPPDCRSGKLSWPCL